MKKTILFIVLATLCSNFTSRAQTIIKITGSIIDSVNRKALPGATIKIKLSHISTATDDHGNFAISTMETKGTLEISFIGYKTLHIEYTPTNHGPFNILMEKDQSALKEISVVSTGYQTIPRERSTGSYDQIDNKLFNRSVGTNLIDRLIGVTSGLASDGYGFASTTVSTGASFRVLGISIRGTSTLSDKVNTDPLIVLDGFPYEGNISNINPNDVESITVLKDAAAASIWGARSGNGVIVITSKKGKRNQPLSVEINSSLTFQNKPNLYHYRNYLNTNDYINLETSLFKQGYFDSYLSDIYNQPAVSPVVDILDKMRSGTVSASDGNAQINALKNNDVRHDFEKYIYQKAIKQQYSISLKGGTNQNSYIFSAGYDNNQDNLVRNGYYRLTVNALNTYTPVKNLEITTGLNYSQNTTKSNNRLGYPYGISVGGAVNGIYPYAAFAEANGNHLTIVKDYLPSYTNAAVANGLLDWSYRPLDELAFADHSTKVNDLLLRASARYKFTSFLNAEVQYQNERQVVDSRNYQNAQTYYARNLINQFTIIDPSTGAATYQFPKGGILTLGDYDLVSNNLRAQINYNQTFNNKYNITAIAGSEVRELKSSGFTRNSYGYDDQFGTAVTNLDYADYLNTNPIGNSAQIPSPDGSVSGTVNRYVSYFANAAYSYDDRYTFTISGRKDGANIFGVKTNDKITPLWSAGLGWTINKEDFFAVDWLPYLKARVSYGFNGNVYNGSAYVTGTYGSTSLTGASIISGLTAPNPYLRWEKVKNINAGIDFALKNNRISGTVEWYEKNGEDLIENIPLYSSSGFQSYYGNAAATSTKGLDITLNSQNLTGKLKWNTTLLLSTLHDKVISFNAPSTSTSFQSINGIPTVGKSLFGLYSYKWGGLDPSNGDPQGYLNGKISKNYTPIINNYKPDSLVYNGSARPTVYGGFRNDFAYKNFSVSINITYELGYYFRRGSTSINAANIISGSGQNVDYAQRWQHPGDESHTSVPSIVYPSNNVRNTFYQYSSILVNRADNIRLQDIRFSYDITNAQWHHMPFKSIQVYSYLSNLGLIWRANKFGIDPDLGSVVASPYPNPFTIAFGFNIHL